MAKFKMKVIAWKCENIRVGKIRRYYGMITETTWHPGCDAWVFSKHHKRLNYDN